MFGGIELVAKGRKAAQAYIEHYTKGPDVHSAGVFTVTAVLEDFRSDIRRRAAPVQRW